MKTAVLFITIMAFGLLGCKKTEVQEQEKIPVFKFKANGIQYVWLDSTTTKGQVFITRDNYNRYVLKAADTLLQFPYNAIYISITTDTKLRPKNYEYSNMTTSGLVFTLSLKKENDFSELYTNWDLGNVSITISKIVNNFASGAFHANLSDGMKVDGEFAQIQIAN